MFIATQGTQVIVFWWLVFTGYFFDEITPGKRLGFVQEVYRIFFS
jgi:hypothetical protein